MMSTLVEILAEEEFFIDGEWTHIYYDLLDEYEDICFTAEIRGEDTTVCVPAAIITMFHSVDDVYAFIDNEIGLMLSMSRSVKDRGMSIQ